MSTAGRRGCVVDDVSLVVYVFLAVVGVVLDRGGKHHHRTWRGRCWRSLI